MSTLKTTVWLGAILCALWLCVSTMWSEQGALRLKRLRTEVEQKRREIEQLEARVQREKKKLIELTKSKTYEEQYVRDQMGMVKSDETVFIFKSASASRPTTSETQP